MGELIITKAEMASAIIDSTMNQKGFLWIKDGYSLYFRYDGVSYVACFVSTSDVFTITISATEISEKFRESNYVKSYLASSIISLLEEKFIEHKRNN